MPCNTTQAILPEVQQLIREALPETVSGEVKRHSSRAAEEDQTCAAKAHAVKM